jgi:outer membrane receptor protein involved in Fe transport
MFSRLPLRLAAPLLCVLLCLPTALWAQQVPPAPVATPAPDAAAPSAEENPPSTPPSGAPADAVLAPIVVDARRLNDARTGIQTQLGASVYTIDAAAIAAMPGGDNSLLNQVVLQAPEVAQDSFGQFHVRGEHNGLQYRLNGIILPEGISVFGQSLDPRLVSSLSLITGALPAEYGLRTAGIIDLTTKSGALDPGGAISIYGGSHGTIEPSINYGGSSGRFQYLLSADALTNDLGIESPDGSSTPLHDRTKQYHVFSYFEDVIDANDRVSLILALSDGAFQIPDLHNQQPALGLSVNGQSSYASAALNENQREQTQFAIVSWQHSVDALDFQTSFTARNSTLQFTPDPLGDLLFNGISQNAYKRNAAYDLQTDAAYQVNDRHTLRAGVFVQSDTSTSLTGSLVLPAVSSAGTGGLQTSQIPETIVDNGSKTENIESLYLQDEWKWARDLTFNYGLRLDTFSAYTSATQLSPRVNLVWKATPATTVHAGYARYLSPPPFELVGAEDVARFNNTTAAPQVTTADTPKAERANYTDIGVLQNVTQQLTIGLDTYYKLSTNLIDEGQFGAPIILTPFNYQSGRQYGEELTLNYAGERFSFYGNLSWESAMGRDIDSAQFNFTSAELAYIANNYIHLDHEQKVTASAGASYHWGDTRLSSDFLLGSGLRADLVEPDGSNIPNGMHLPYYTQLNAGLSHLYHLKGAGTLTVRLDVINVFDREYQIRNGTGVGVGAPQYGPRRGYFLGLSKSL